MRVGEETRSVSGFQDRTLIRPSVHTGAPDPIPSGLRPFPPDRGNRPLDKGSRPHRGEGFGPVQIGGNLGLCGTFGYIYWEFGRSAPVGGGRPSVPPLRQGLGKNGGRTMCAPTREGAGNCLLIRPSGRPAADGPKYGQIFYYVTFCDVFSKNSTKAAENIKIFLKTGCVHPGIFLHLQIRFLSNFVL